MYRAGRQVMITRTIDIILRIVLSIISIALCIILIVVNENLLLDILVFIMLSLSTGYLLSLVVESLIDSYYL